MPNPNKLGTSQTPNQAPDGGETSRTRAELQATGQKPNRAVEQEGNRFLHISREELLKVDPSNLLPSEVPDFVAAHQAWIDKYQKIIDAAKEKEATLATEKEAALASETEAAAATETEAAPAEPDLSGLDTINADREPAQESTTEVASPTVNLNAPTEPIGVVPAAPSTTPNDAPGTSETIDSIDRISPETLAATKEKAKQKSSLKETLTKKVLPVVLVAAILISGIVGINAVGKNSNNQSNNSTPATEQSGGTYGSYDEYDAASEQHEQHGIKDGYYEAGMYASPNKSTAVDFAYAPEVAKSIDSNDAREIAIAVADAEVEVMANQIAAMPDEVKAHYGLADFKGLGWKAVEQKLEEMNASSPDLFDSISQCHHNAMRDAQYSIDHVSGSVVNGYIQHNGTDRYVHGNMEGVQCTTQEDNTSVAKFTWSDITSEDMMMKIQYDEQGNVIGGCIQLIFLAGSAKAILVMDGVPSIVELPPGNPNNPNNPNSPDNPNNPDDPDNPNKEWGKSGDPRSGPNRLPSDQVDPDSEISQAENDAKNRGHQGYVDDNQAAPGSASENNGTNADGFSNIITDGADTDGGRMSGGEQQGSSDQNGSNANAPTADQIARDNAGNAAQDNGNVAGGNNNSDEAEQDRVAGGQF